MRNGLIRICNEDMFHIVELYFQSKKFSWSIGSREEFIKKISTLPSFLYFSLETKQIGSILFINQLNIVSFDDVVNYMYFVPQNVKLNDNCNAIVNEDNVIIKDEVISISAIKNLYLKVKEVTGK